MCDYSLQNVKSRPAKVGDKLTTQQLLYWHYAGLLRRKMPTRRFAFFRERSSPLQPVRCRRPRGLFGWKANMIAHTTAIFRQINKDNPRAHHDALEFPDGQIVLLTHVIEGQEATVLQLPAQPATAAEAKAQERVAHVG